MSGTTFNPSEIQAELTKYGMTGLWNPNDPLMDQYKAIAGNYVTNKTPHDSFSFFIATMISRSVLYHHKTPGDCGSPAQYQGNAALSVGKFGSLGVSTAGTVLGAFGIAALGPGALIAAPFAIFSIVGAHHAAAVKKEQEVLCAATVQANGFFQNLDASLAAGQVSVTVAIQQLDLLGTGADQFISQVRQDCNAGCVITRSIHCLIDLRKYIYKQAQVSGGGAVAAAAASLVKSDTIAYAALAALAAKFIGVF